MTEFLSTIAMSIVSIYHRMFGKPKQPQQQQQQRQQQQRQQNQQNDDVQSNKYNDQDSELSDIKTIYVIADVEKRLQIIQNNYNSCKDDDANSKILFREFLKGCNKLSKLRDDHNKNNAKLLKSIHNSITSNAKAKNNTKFNNRLSEFINDRNLNDTNPDEEFLGGAYMNSVMEHFGLTQDDNDYNDLDYLLTQERPIEEHSDNLPTIPTTPILPSAMKTSMNYYSYSSIPKSVTFEKNNDDDDDNDDEHEQSQDK